MKKVAVIGGGLTGLTTAFYLKKAGIPFHIYEKQNRCGGVIESGKKQGFIYEKGPNTGVVASLELANLLEEISDITSIVYADEKAKKRLILKNGKWHALPSGILSALGTPLFHWKDKIKVAGEYFGKKGNYPSETLENTVKRRLGKSFLDYAIDPFVSGVYAGDPSKLITKYAFPKLYNLEEKYGGFIKGSIKLAKERSAEYKQKVNKKIFSFENGLQELTDALVQKAGKENISLNQENLEVKYLSPNRFQINGQEYSHVVSTIPSKNLKKVFPFISPELYEKTASLIYAPVIEISLGFKKWEGMNLEAFGGLIPSKEKKNLLGILFMSSQFPRRAPGKGAFFSVFMGGIKKKDFINLDNETIIKLLEKDFMELMNLKKFNPELLEISRHPAAIAQYGTGTPQRLEAIEMIEENHPGFLIKGSIKDGIGIADRVTQSYHTAQEIKGI